MMGGREAGVIHGVREGKAARMALAPGHGVAMMIGRKTTTLARMTHT